jgi:hypothetical protein
VAGPDGRPRAVLAALRGPGRPPFTEADRARLAELAWTTAPALRALELQAGLAREAEPQVPPEQELVYRNTALAFRAKGGGEEGELVELSPRWVRWAYPLLLLALATGLAFGFVARVTETAAGPAFVRVADGRVEVIALLPGASRPLLEPGMPLRVELPGFADAARTLAIGAVGEVAGPREVERLLGERLAGSAAATGTAVPVRADLPRSGFESGGRRYRWHDGMPARAEVPVRKRRLLTSLFPGLRALLGEE